MSCWEVPIHELGCCNYNIIFSTKNTSSTKWWILCISLVCSAFYWIYEGDVNVIVFSRILSHYYEKQTNLPSTTDAVSTESAMFSHWNVPNWETLNNFYIVVTFMCIELINMIFLLWLDCTKCPQLLTILILRARLLFFTNYSELYYSVHSQRSYIKTILNTNFDGSKTDVRQFNLGIAGLEGIIETSSSAPTHCKRQSQCLLDQQNKISLLPSWKQ